MMLSKTCDYGIRAAIFVAGRKDQQFTPIGEISEQLNISFHFLTKILQRLTQESILKSYRGSNGGVALARAAHLISLKDIVSAIDGDNPFGACLLGLNQCSDHNPCPLHEQWNLIRKKMESLFEKTTLAKLATATTAKRFRLTDLTEP
ncbi:MAG: transcriptional regulator [candidate division Zixibacteria bacterium CG_4_9_14_3_um_filter_46_8]|nr:MAG: transcriptional regulator [candidate division Zixibacteria bacterium CG_4_9_14_3_um_filter_46_8]